VFRDYFRQFWPAAIWPRQGHRPAPPKQLPASLFANAKEQSILSYMDFCKGKGFPKYPLEIFLELSNICDLKCAMCVEFSALNRQRLQIIKGKERGFQEVSNFDEHLSGVLEHALAVHCFGYGEPTIHPQFKSVLEFASRYEVLIDFFTNGMHLDDALCSFLVDKRIQALTVSFSGADKATYENIYLGGEFERVLGGIKRLADRKAAHGSPYPVIQINSLGFRDHVSNFEKFVELLGSHGANIIYLKQLQTNRAIPQIYEHVSIARPDKEGEIVRRAIERGKELGVTINAAQYLSAGARDEVAYQQRMHRLINSMPKDTNAKPFGKNPINEFREVAAVLKSNRNASLALQTPSSLDPNTDRGIADALLRIDGTNARAKDGSTFVCMEPFKTMYITQNGATKPCCFGHAQAVHLGSVAKSDGLHVWSGAGFGAVRAGIMRGEYPQKMCTDCLRKRAAPNGQIAHHLIGKYVQWHKHCFGKELHDRVWQSDLNPIREIRFATPTTIIKKHAERLATR
jgi:MoaA/NifB/PqqE/SkfB family radical SAM enzyme